MLEAKASNSKEASRGKKTRRNAKARHCRRLISSLTDASAPRTGSSAVRAMPETTLVMLWSTFPGWPHTPPLGAVIYTENV